MSGVVSDYNQDRNIDRYVKNRLFESVRSYGRMVGMFMAFLLFAPQMISMVSGFLSFLVRRIIMAVKKGYERIVREFDDEEDCKEI